MRSYISIGSFKIILYCFHLHFDNLHILLVLYGRIAVSRVKYKIITEILNFSMKLYEQTSDKIDRL